MTAAPDTPQNPDATRRRIEELLRDNRQLREALEQASSKKTEIEAELKSALESLADLTARLKKAKPARKRRLFF